MQRMHSHLKLQMKDWPDADLQNPKLKNTAYDKQ